MDSEKHKVYEGADADEKEDELGVINLAEWDNLFASGFMDFRSLSRVVKNLSREESSFLLERAKLFKAGRGGGALLQQRPEIIPGWSQAPPSPATRRAASPSPPAHPHHPHHPHPASGPFVRDAAPTSDKIASRSAELAARPARDAGVAAMPSASSVALKARGCREGDKGK